MRKPADLITLGGRRNVHVGAGGQKCRWRTGVVNELNVLLQSVIQLKR